MLSPTPAVASRSKQERSTDMTPASERRCDNDVKSVAYYNDEDVEDPNAKAVRCRDVDADL